MISIRIGSGEFRAGSIYVQHNTIEGERYSIMAPTNARTGKVEPLIFGVDIERLELQPDGKPSELNFMGTLRDGRRFSAVCKSSDYKALEDACAVREPNELALSRLKKWKELLAKEVPPPSVPLWIKVPTLVIVGIALIGICAPEGPYKRPVEKIVDVPALAGKTQTQVERAIGSGHCVAKRLAGTTKAAQDCLYGKFKITYIEGKADWFELKIPADKKPEIAIQFAGYPETAPMNKYPKLRGYWQFPGILEATLSRYIGDDDDVLTVYVATKMEFLEDP